MAVRRLAVPRDAPPRLDRFLARALPGYSSAQVQRLLAEGKVRVNGTRAKPLRRLVGGETVELELPAPRPPPRVEGPPLPVLYEDAQLVIIDKPAGLVVEPEGRAPSVVTTLASQLQGLDVGGAALPGVAHRLDRDTTGCLALARTDEGLARLLAAFQAGAVTKTYLALVLGAPPDHGALDTPYAKDPANPRRYTTRLASPRRARLAWRVLERLGPLALLEIALDTGRTHQIRAQLAEAGFPLVGDPLYGTPEAQRHGFGRTALHALRLRLEGVAEAPVEVEAPLPADFRAALGAARGTSRPA